MVTLMLSLLGNCFSFHKILVVIQPRHAARNILYDCFLKTLTVTGHTSSGWKCASLIINWKRLEGTSLGLMEILWTHLLVGTGQYYEKSPVSVKTIQARYELTRIALTLHRILWSTNRSFYRTLSLFLYFLRRFELITLPLPVYFHPSKD
jgi:hypothetical protein